VNCELPYFLKFVCTFIFLVFIIVIFMFLWGIEHVNKIKGFSIFKLQVFIFEDQGCFSMIHNAHVCKTRMHCILVVELKKFGQFYLEFNIGFCFYKCASLILEMCVHCSLCTLYNLDHSSLDL
jgi:hypothetical protein